MAYYVINTPLFDDKQFAYGDRPDHINSAEPQKCKICGSFLTVRKWLPPYEVKLSKKIAGDFIFGAFPGIIVSGNFKNLYLKEGLKGIKSFTPVRTLYRKVQLDLEYYYPDIVMSEARTDIERSGLEFDGDGNCPHCQKAGRVIKDMKGLYFEDDNMIKEDIFNSMVIVGPIISERFRQMAEGYHLTNLLLAEASTYRPSFLF